MYSGSFSIDDGFRMLKSQRQHASTKQILSRVVGLDLVPQETQQISLVRKTASNDLSTIA